MTSKAQVAAYVNSGNKLVAVIGDEDTVTGFLLAGTGNQDDQKRSNFLIVNNKTTQTQIEETFVGFTKRSDIALILINQHVADDIRHLLANYSRVLPAVLEIPSKDHPYDPTRDSVMDRVRMLSGVAGK